MIRLFILGYLILFSFIFCKNKTSEESSPITGHIKIGCDNNLMGIILQEENVFESAYKYADVAIRFYEEADLYDLFYKDSFDIIISARSLNKEELDYLEGRGIHPKQYEFGRSALAFITNKSNPDTAIRYESLLKLITMEPVQNFKSVIIENKKSGIPQHLLNLTKQSQFPNHVYAKSNKSEIIDYLENEPSAMGIIDWSAISDSDDPEARKFLNKIRLLAVSRPIDSLQMGYVMPYQYYLQDKIYPFTRDLYIISKSGKNDLGLGFASFIAGEIGQKILLKAGLLPKYQSERWVELKNEGIKVVK